jgi:hypothetical protein
VESSDRVDGLAGPHVRRYLVRRPKKVDRFW